MATRSRIASVPMIETPAEKTVRKPRTPRTPEQVETARVKREATKAAKAAAQGKLGARLLAIPPRRYIAAGIVVAIIGLLSLSLSHIAEAIALLTHTSARDAWWIGLAIDAGMVLCELGILFGQDGSKEACERVVFTGFGLSILLNVVAFCSHTPWTCTWAVAFTWTCDIIIGIAIPTLVYLLSQAAGRLAK